MRCVQQDLNFRRRELFGEEGSVAGLGPGELLRFGTAEGL